MASADAEPIRPVAGTKYHFARLSKMVGDGEINGRLAVVGIDLED